MELEVPPKEALEAGNAVQWYVLAKTARRRIRNYLRNHDSIWLKDLRLGEFGAEDLDGGTIVWRSKTLLCDVWLDLMNGIDESEVSR